MRSARTFSAIQLVNGSTGDPVLYIDYPGKDDSILFDGGDNGRLSLKRLGDLEAVFITHHHVDHFIGLDRIVRANMDRDKVLYLFGPQNTIRKVRDRIISYEYPFFPFQKIVLRITEVLPGKLRTGLLECTRQFPEPTIVEKDWTGPLLYENEYLQVEAAFTDHTVPGLAYALVEKTGYHPVSERLAQGILRPGAWVTDVLNRLRAGEAMDTVLEINGGRFTLQSLADQYFAVSQGTRVAYITDTALSDASRPGLLRLANRATRLYCDSFYSQTHIKQALQYRHMTATQAAELAKAAKVDQLILIHFAQRYAGKYEELIAEARAIFPRVSADLESERRSASEPVS
jgi:ribonuclease Z